MAVTALSTSWLGYEAATGKLFFWGGKRFLPLADAAGYATPADLATKLSLTGGTLGAPEIDLASQTLTADTNGLYFNGQPLTTAAQVGDALDDYLPLYGGELTGTLKLPQLKLAGQAVTADANGLYFQGKTVSIVGTGHYRMKGITRLYSGTTVAIAADTRAVLVRGVGGGGGGGAQGGASCGAAGGGGAGGTGRQRATGNKRGPAAIASVSDRLHRPDGRTQHGYEIAECRGFQNLSKIERIKPTPAEPLVNDSVIILLALLWHFWFSGFGDEHFHSAGIAAVVLVRRCRGWLA